MGQPMFSAPARETFDHRTAGWVGRERPESPNETTDRLVLHGLRMGKTSAAKLAYHAGFTPSTVGQRVKQALERLERRGLARREGKGWVAA